MRELWNRIEVILQLNLISKKGKTGEQQYVTSFN